jgi:hypothetical protein
VVNRDFGNTEGTCGSELAHEEAGTFNRDVPDRTPSRASSLPHGFVVNRDFGNTEGTCGSELAHEEAGTFNRDVA